MTSNFLYFSFSTLHSSSLWRNDTIVCGKLNKPTPLPRGARGFMGFFLTLGKGGFIAYCQGSVKLVSQTTRFGRLGLHFWQSVKTSCVVLVCENNSYLIKLGLVIMSKNHTKLGLSGHPACYCRKTVCCVIGFVFFFLL